MIQKTFPPITRDQLKAYAEASGDYNPIHLDDEVAKKAGLPGVIAHGMLVASFLSDVAESYCLAQLKPLSKRVESFQVRFKSMTFPGDTITVTASLKGDGQSLGLEAKNQKGETVSVATLKWHQIN